MDVCAAQYRESKIAIAFPLKAKFIFTVRRTMFYVTVLGALGTLLWIYFATLQQIKPTLTVIGPLNCLTDTSSMGNIVLFKIVTNMAILTIPLALNLIIGLLLLFYIRRQQEGSIIQRGASTGIKGAVVVVIMAIVHSIINLPAGILEILYIMYAFLKS